MFTTSTFISTVKEMGTHIFTASSSAKKRAVDLYKLAFKEKKSEKCIRREVEIVAAVCLYASLREEGEIITLRDVYNRCEGLSNRKIAQTHKFLRERMKESNAGPEYKG